MKKHAFLGFFFIYMSSFFWDDPTIFFEVNEKRKLWMLKFDMQNKSPNNNEKQISCAGIYIYFGCYEQMKSYFCDVDVPVSGKCSTN